MRVRSLPWLVGAAAVRVLSEPDRIRLAVFGSRPSRSTSIAQRIDLAVAADDLIAAQSELGQAEENDAELPSLTAAVLLLAGEISAAEAAAEQALVGRSSAGRVRARRVIRRARGIRRELGVPVGEGALAGARSTTHPSTPSPTRKPTAGRILHVVKNSLPYVQAGYTLRTQRVLRAQSAAGLDVRAVTRLGFPVVQGRMGDRVDVVDGISYHRLFDVTGTDVQKFANRLADLARTEGASLLHAATDHVNGRAARLAATDLSIPFVYEVRGFLEDSWACRHGGDLRAAQTDRYRWSRARETEAMLAADAVVTLGEAMAAEIIQRGVRADRVWVVPNGVDDAFLRELRDTREMKTRLGLAPRRLWLGAITTLHSYEGIETLLDAVRSAREAGLDVGAVIVGDGPARPDLERRSVDDGSIRWVGRVSSREAIDWYDAVDAVVVPRHDHKVTRLVTPLKPVEALARAKLVIASDLPALREASGGFARFVAAGDVAGLAEEFGLVSENRELGMRGRAWVESERRWSDVCSTYRAAYASVGLG